MVCLQEPKSQYEIHQTRIETKRLSLRPPKTCAIWDHQNKLKHTLNLYSECYTLSQYEIHQNKDWNFIPLSDYMKNFDVTIGSTKTRIETKQAVSDDNYYLVTIWDPPKQVETD